MMAANKATTRGRAIPDRVILAVVFAMVGITGIWTGIWIRIVVAPRIVGVVRVPGDLLGPRSGQ